MPIKIVPGRPIVDAAKRKERLRELTYLRATYAMPRTYFDTLTPDGKPVLIPFECEEAQDWQERKATTPRRHYVQRFVNRYTSAVFRHDPVRPAGPLDEIYSDCDGLGTTLNAKMADACRQAQIAGRHALVVEDADVPLPDEDLTVAQAQQLLARPVIRDFPAENILAVDRNGNTVIEVLLLMYDSEGVPFARLYTQSFTQDVRFRQAKTVGESSYVVDAISEPLPHGWADIPVAIIEPFADTAQSAPWADHQRQITNLKSQEQLEIRNHTFTRWIVSGVRLNQSSDTGDGLNAPAKQPIRWGSRRMWSFEEENVKVERMGSDTSQSDSIRKSVAEEEEALYRAAGLQANYKLGGAPQSGISREIELEDFSLQAETLSTALMHAENHLLGLITDNAGITPYEGTVYSQDYTEASFEAEVTRSEKLVTLSDSCLAPEEAAAFKRELFMSIARKYVSDAVVNTVG